MNKTNLIALTTLLFVSLAFVSCKKKGCTDPTATNYSSDAEKDDGSCDFSQAPGTTANPIDGTPRTSFNIDGNTVSHISNMDIWSSTSSNKETDGNLTNAVWGSFLFNDAENYSLISIHKGVHNYPTGILSNDDFSDYFTPGTYTYADLSEEGVSIDIGFPGGIYYSSKNGSQVGSTFEIVSIKKIQVGYEMQVKVHIVFNCKVYNGGSSKTITNGVYVGQFSQ